MKLIKETASLCPECLQSVPAMVYQVGSEIQLHRRCPQHGSFAAVINSDVRYYHHSLGATPVPWSDSRAAAAPRGLPVVSPGAPGPDPGGCCGGGCGVGGGSGEDGGVEHLSTCVALIEIVQSCNLACPVCFADSPQKHAVEALSYEEFRQRVSEVVRRKGQIDILQLSGGEPTIHPQFFQLLRWAVENPDIGHVLLNTNGIKLTSDSFFAQLTEVRREFGKVEIYLQYDGPQAAGQITLRGVDLRQVRRTVIERCQAAAIPVNLAMTVDQHNREYLGEALQVAIDHSWVTGITWQPMFGSGRVYAGFNGGSAESRPDSSDRTNDELRSAAERDSGGRAMGSDDLQWPAVRRLNVADIIAGVVSQSQGRLNVADFTPLPCGDPNCHTVGYLLRQGAALLGLSALIDLPAVQGFLQDRLNYNASDLLRCGCESEPLGQILKNLEIGPQKVLRLVIKPFMDAWTYDQHRVDRCCVHVIGAEGRLESFCRHYAMASQRVGG